MSIPSGFHFAERGAKRALCFVLSLLPLVLYHWLLAASLND